MNILKIVILVLTLNLGPSFAEEGHDHSKDAKHKNHKGHVDHKEHDDHDDHKEHDDLDDHKGHDDHDDHKKDDKHKGHGHHDEHGDHGGGKAIGKGKAIVEVDEKKGFKLSKEAIKTLKLKLQNVDGDQFFINKGTLVASKDLKGVYRFRAGFFKLLPAKILKEKEDGYEVKVNGVDFGDQIVINGVGLLRVSDVYSTDKAEYGHAH